MKPLLNTNKILPKKSLGQNFIHDNNFIMKLSSLIISNASTNIFEVGPGKGALTNQLSKKKFKNLFLIEKDEYLFNVLKDKFKDEENIIPICEDALTYNYETANNKNNSLIVGNLPFNISSQLLINWIMTHNWPPFYSKMILMFQKEVADRIMASHNQKNYSRISVITQARCRVKKLLKAPSNIFFPKPKVDGTVLEFTPIIKNAEINILSLQKVLKQSFKYKRKKIKTSLKDYTSLLKLYKIDENLRAENLSVEDYCNLASAI